MYVLCSILACSGHDDRPARQGVLYIRLHLLSIARFSMDCAQMVKLLKVDG